MKLSRKIFIVAVILSVSIIFLGIIILKPFVKGDGQRISEIEAIELAVYCKIESGSYDKDAYDIDLTDCTQKRFKGSKRFRNVLIELESKCGLVAIFSREAIH